MNKKVLILFLLVFPLFLSSKTIYVSQDGNLKGKGSSKSPFIEINQAVQQAMPGDTILVKEGTYRERVIPIRSGEEGKPIVFLAEEGKKVTIKGSELWSPDWKEYSKGIYYASPDQAMFDDIKEDYVDSHNPFEVLLASTPFQRGGLQEVRRGWAGDSTIVYTCGQVFVNSQMFKEVAALGELNETNSWYYNPENKAIYVNFGDQNPKNQSVEITTRRRIFAPSERGLGYITVQGFLMEHCGNQYPTNFWMEPLWAQRGALGFEAGHNWIVRRNIIRFAKANAIDCGYVDSATPLDVEVADNIIEENYIVDNGASGILSNRSLNLIIRNNVIMRNNTLLFEGPKRWEHSGVKCHDARNAYIHNNYIADHYLTDGIWLDNKFQNSRISRNVIVNNENRGIFLEMSDNPFDMILIDNNVIVGNAQNAVYCHDSSGATILHNLIANTPTQGLYGQGLMVRQVKARTKTYHYTVYNNIFAGNLPIIEFNYPSHRSGEQRIDCNIYNSKEGDADFHITSSCEIPRPWTNEEFYEKIQEEVKSIGPLKESFKDETRVMLTFDQWKYFWASHNCMNDEGSTLNDRIIVNYHPTSQEISIKVGLDPKETKSKNHKLLDVDFFGQAIEQNENATPGPFQSLKEGSNLFKVWKGLPILTANELPNFTIFNTHK